LKPGSIIYIPAGTVLIRSNNIAKLPIKGQSSTFSKTSVPHHAIIVGAPVVSYIGDAYPILYKGSVMWYVAQQDVYLVDYEKDNNADTAS
jgi:hypothetical protein